MNAETRFDFSLAVIEASQRTAVLVDFWAPWCGPCRTLTPILERVAERFAGRLTLVKINTEDEPDIAVRFGIRSIPNVKLFIAGKVADEFTGALPESEIVRWLETRLPDPLADHLSEVESLLREGSADAAAGLARQLLTASPGHPRAAVLLGRALVTNDPAQACDAVSAIGADSDFHAEAEAIRGLARLFGLLADPDQLPDVPAKPRYLAAIENLRANKFAEALTEWVDIVSVDRKLDDDGPRKACVAIFKLLGDNHPLTLEFRPKLSRALYS